MTRPPTAGRTWRPGKTPSLCFRQKSAGPRSRGPQPARTLLKFWGSSLWGRPSQNFFGNLFLRSSGFPGRPPGWSGPSSRLCGARAGGPFSDFLGSRLGPFPFFLDFPDALRAASHAFSADAPSHQFARAPRAGGAYHQSRRGRVSRASSSCFAGKPFT
jgi:hypothetical protein